MNDAWIADRMKHIDASGIRKAFEMAKAMKDPINLSIGLPDFDVAGPVKAAAIEAIERGHNAYTVTQGIPELRTSFRPPSTPQFDHADRQVLVTGGHVGRPAAGPVLRGQPGRRGHHLRSLFRDVPPPGDAGRRDVRSWSTPIPTSASTSPRSPRPHHRADQVRRRQHARPIRPASSPRPTRCAAWPSFADERDVLLISDEVYRAFCYDHPFATPASWNEDVLVVDGFSKSHGMTGWRLGYAHGPAG